MEQWLKKEMTALINQRVADLYLLPYQGRYRLTAHVRGRLVERRSLTQEVGQQLIAFFKYRADMAVTEHRRPQAGGISWPSQHGPVNLRLSTVGDFCERESLVIRFIYPISGDYQLLVPDQWGQLEGITARRGLVLFAGPLGSGKTTTMYRLAREHRQETMVMTIEDPVEVEEPWFFQTQVNELAGLGYQELLRVSLRHRPQILIIGEIRDPETAAMAVRAGLSGLLVLATVHARSAPGVFQRLHQLGVSHADLDQTVSGACYQRLVPLKSRRVAVLFDLVTKRPSASSPGVAQATSGGWKRALREAVKNDQITTATATQLAAG